MTKELLIVFLRAPELGKVKTRLAATVGNEKALAIYQQLLSHTLRQASRLRVRKETWYAEATINDGISRDLGSDVHVQRGEDLGARMAYAIGRAFEAGQERVVIIGTDCPGMSSELLERAFAELEQHDAVIGPARDGGYYLLGLRRLVDALFRNKAWSGDTVFHDTVLDLKRMGLSCAVLPELIDVDKEEDLAHMELPC